MMKNICCIKCNKYKKNKNINKFFIFFGKTLVISIFCDECHSKDEDILKENNRLMH